VFFHFSRIVSPFAIVFTTFSIVQRHKYWRICYLVTISHYFLAKGAVFGGFQTFSRVFRVSPFCFPSHNFFFVFLVFVLGCFN
jgi:hypothetical protein